MFIFQSKFNNHPYRDRITEKSGTSKKNQWDFQISKVGSLDFLNLKVNGSPGLIGGALTQAKSSLLSWFSSLTTEWKAADKPSPVHKIVNIFILITFNIGFGCLKEPSHWDGSFEYTQHLFWLRNKKINF